MSLKHHRLKLVRRDGVEYGVNLSRRRAWYDETQTPGGETPPETPPGDDLPGWVKDPKQAYEEIQRLRRESAKYRDEAKAAKQPGADKPPQPEKPEKIDKTPDWQKLLDEQKAELEKLKAAAMEATRRAIVAEFGLPKELSSRLQGQTEDELRKDAEALKALIPPGGQQQRNTTAVVPGGQPPKETDAQRRERLKGGGASRVFGNGVVNITTPKTGE